MSDKIELSKRFKIKERKLFETTQYLITICRRLTSDLPYGIEKECYFISEDVKDALKNVGTKQARVFVKEIEKAELQKKFNTRPKADSNSEVIGMIESLTECLEVYMNYGCAITVDASNYRKWCNELTKIKNALTKGG